MALDINQAVRRACLWLPESAEHLSHGSPDFRVRGKTFASFVVNHHGDGRVALWLPAQPGAQESLVRAQPKHFFVPPYVGPRGWIGVNLDRGIAWSKVVGLVREAYEKVAPKDLKQVTARPPSFTTAPKKLSPAEIDPFKSARAVAVLKRFRPLCLKLPEVSEAEQFGHPVWQAAKKTFAIARFHERKLTLCFWVGVDAQGMLSQDPRYRIPPYIGHNGWIALDVSGSADWTEIGALLIESYRHFAKKRLLQQLDPQGE
jgi:predicted DNA-binding protein (MmcQ/YjbR family)